MSAASTCVLVRLKRRWHDIYIQVSDDDEHCLSE